MGASSRSCKYVFNTLVQTFQIRSLANTVKESTLDILITELLLWLLDERVPHMDDGSQLLKALNVLDFLSSFLLQKPRQHEAWMVPLDFAMDSNNCRHLMFFKRITESPIQEYCWSIGRFLATGSIVLMSCNYRK